MLYDKNVRRICAHCLHGKSFNDRHDLCQKYGPVPPDFTCPRFKYDPLRRKPPLSAAPVTKPEGSFDL